MPTTSEVIAEVRAVASVLPNRVIPAGRCSYVSDGQPQCLLGHALWNLGVIDADMEHAASNGLVFEVILHNLDVDVESSQQEQWLSAVQSRQDKQSTWSEAVAYADEHRSKMGYLS